MLCAVPCHASASTNAGVVITNSARIDATIGGQSQSATSNPVDLVVGELIEVALARTGSYPVSVTSDNIVVAVTLNNLGNGGETFDLAVIDDKGLPVAARFAIDTDGDGRYDPARDRVIDGARTPRLAPGERLALLAIVAAAPTLPVSLTIIARASTGSGNPGASFAGRGDGGGDAVVGSTGGIARVIVPLDADPAMPVLVKSQAVRAPDGSARAMHGAVVTYTLEARFTGASAAVRIADPIPKGTTYLPGSLMLDELVLSDAADTDQGRVDAAGISVALGDVAAGHRTVRFQVTIQ